MTAPTRVKVTITLTPFERDLLKSLAVERAQTWGDLVGVLILEEVSRTGHRMRSLRRRLRWSKRSLLGLYRR